MAFWQLYGSVVLFIWAFMTTLWIASLVLRNSSIVDPMWGTGLVLSNWFSFLITPHGYPARKLLISVLVTIWGLNGQVTPATLSRHLFLEPHSVSELIIRMEKKGLVTKRKDTERENIVRISITEKGREFCLQAVQSDFIHHVMSTLSEEQREQLRTCLSTIFDEALKELGMEAEPPLLGGL